MTDGKCVLCGVIPAAMHRSVVSVKYRKSVMFVMQQNFARVGAMAAGKAPFNAKVGAQSAAVAESHVHALMGGLCGGTDTGDSRAKPVIWKERAKFQEWWTRCRPGCQPSPPLRKPVTWTASRQRWAPRVLLTDVPRRLSQRANMMRAAAAGHVRPQSKAFQSNDEARQSRARQHSV